MVGPFLERAAAAARKHLRLAIQPTSIIFQTISPPHFQDFQKKNE